jgi:ankyrin repeat protein
MANNPVMQLLSAHSALTPVFMNDHPEVLKLLIASGADPSIKNEDGLTALQSLLNARAKQ